MKLLPGRAIRCGRKCKKEMIKTAEENTALLVNAQERAKKMIENYIMQLGETTGTEYQITWKYE